LKAESDSGIAETFVGAGALEKTKTKKFGGRAAYSDDHDEALLLDDDNVGPLA
jgi:hypothetical protein